MKEEIPALTQPPHKGAEESTPPPAADAPDAGPAAAAPPVREARAAGPGAPLWPAALAVLALAVGALGLWQGWQAGAGGKSLRDELASRLAAVEGIGNEARTLARQQQETLIQQQGKLGALEAKLAATEGQAAALEALYQEFSRSREDRVMAEIEQAVTIAGQQLQLAGNVEAALIALQGAEARLALQDRGQLIALRRAVGRDIEALRALPQVDVQGLALRLERLQERVDVLPLAYAGELPAELAGDAAAEADAPSFESRPLDFLATLGLDLWRELKTLVRVERLDQSEPVLMAPAQSTFLRENVKIRLLTARLALLARDGRTYAADLAQARGWMERFFDLRDAAVQAAVADLAALEATPVVIEQITTLESMAALRLMQARAAEGGVVATPPAAGSTSAADER